MNKILITFIVSLISLSCVHTSQTQKDIQNVINTPLNIGMFHDVMHCDSIINYHHFRQMYDFVSVVYLKDGCMPCYPEFVKWNQKKEQFDHLSNYSVLFIIETKDYKRFVKKAREVDSNFNENYHIIMDLKFKYNQGNSKIQDWILNSSVLINSENKIKMVGAPWINEEMTELFYSICTE